MLELAKRLTLLTPEQIEEVQTLIIRNKKDETVVEDNDGTYNSCIMNPSSNPNLVGR